jgi:WD40 repeat protein
VLLWDLQATRLRGSVNVGLSPGLELGTTLSFTPDGKLLAVMASEGKTSIIDVSRAALSEVRPKSGGAIGHGVRYSPDGRFLVTNVSDQPLEVVDLLTAKVRTLELPKHVYVDRMEFAPRSSVVGFTTTGSIVEVWDLASWTRLYTRDDMAGTPVAFSPDGQRFAVGGSDPMFVWDRGRGTAREVLRNSDVRALTWTPDGTRVVAACGDRAVRMMDADTGRRRVFLGHTDAATHVAMAPDGTWFASAGVDGVVRVWSAELGDVPREPAEVRAWLTRVTSAEIAPGREAQTRVRSIP